MSGIVVVEGHAEPYLWQALASLGLAATAIASLGFFVASLLANRRALSIVSLELGAVAPVRPGDAYACRSCGAPLPEREDRVLVPCLYCKAENVTGCDLLRTVQRTSAHEQSATSALQHRRRARLRLLVALLLSPLAVHAALTQVVQIGRWAPALDPRDLEWWTLRTNAIVENQDGRYRTLRLRDGEDLIERTIPAHSTARVSCRASACTLESGEGHHALDDSSTSLVIRGGDLRRAKTNDL
jgi:hypothetical protein